MTISDIAIRRPVFTTMVLMAIIVFGTVSFQSIGIDLYPRVEFPVIVVISVLPGADPETIETTVSDPIEEAVSTISSIKHLRSVSSDSVSQVIIEFELEKNVDVAYQEVQARLGSIRSLLPDDLEDPTILKMDIDDVPILSIMVSGDLPIRELTHLADKGIKERLQRIRNVGQVRLVGGQERKMWLWLDPAKLEGFGLTVQDVEQALRTEHIEYPGGRVETGSKEYLVKTKAEFASAEEFANMVVTYRNNAPVRVKDLGWVEDGMEEQRSLARLNEQRAVALEVRRQSGTNTVEVADAVKREVEALRKELASRGIRLEIAQDLSHYIKESVREVHFHLVFGGGLAILIVFFFLRNPRSTFISSLVLPTSVIGTFTLMFALGFTQNTMTLLALSLSIGLLIDDAIVVQENIMRHIEAGLPRREAAGRATHEIALAVFATTLSVVAVFVPVAFMKGIVGQFFYQFGLCVAFAVLLSMFVSFTLDPMLSSRILRPPKRGLLYRVSEVFFNAIDTAYEWLLRIALRHRWAVILIAVASLYSAVYLAQFLKTEFLPKEDRSEFNIRVKAPLGSSLSYTDSIMRTIRQRIQTQPWVAYTFTTIGAGSLERVNEGLMYVRMTEKTSRTISQSDAMAWVRTQLADMADVKSSVEMLDIIGGGNQRVTDVELELRGTDLGRLEAAADEVMDFLRSAGGYVDIDTSYEKDRPQLNVYVKRDRAADLGVSPLAVAATIKALIGGNEIGKFRAAGDRYDISVRLQEPFRNRPEAINRLKVRNNRGGLVSLDNVVRVVEETGPVQIDRHDRVRQVTVRANLEDDQKVLGDAVAELSEFLQRMNFPPGYSYMFSGYADVMAESFSYLLFALMMTIIMVYMVLAAQFESFVHPFTIMLTLPLSVVGALGAVIVTGKTINIMTLIGMIMLMGLVTKNAILLVDFTNTLRTRDGMERNAAILKAGPIRLRPILMTTFAIIFGMLPGALGTGEGSESRSPMSISVIGGLTTSTLLSLVVVPVVYTLFDDLMHPRAWRIWNGIHGRKLQRGLAAESAKGK
ncbi:MAG TPA: efflux RND transporter permease subunit [bacterium]|nr:efflux RND transporter permease subunit [bacterium]